MKISQAFFGVNKVFLDTAPIIYDVEGTPGFGEVVREVFNLLAQGSFQAVGSPVTLAECLVMPIRLGKPQIQRDFIELLTNTDGISFIPITASVSQKAAEITVSYGLKLPDALQIAAALVAGCDAFLTNDTALMRVTELRILVLGALQI
ncbi:MAG: type II toxin-antitoxin system VapC family toxin [Rivularia sp. T60_A2020_040]|nr:type II toxin-antitoxin system VapC family toxin [Rivularia sp. T60_A2020_040]